MNFEDRLTILMSTIFTSISLVDFKTILDIVLIVISILNLIFVIACKVYRYIKNDGKIDKQEAQDIMQDVANLESKIKEGVEIGRTEGREEREERK